MNHTPEPWQQGRLLDTPQTLRWTKEERERTDAFERRLLFANFTAADQGKSRERVAEFRKAEDAVRVYYCVNAMAGVSDNVLGYGKTFTDPVERLREMANLIERNRNKVVG